MTTTPIESLRDLGIYLGVYAADGRSLAEANEWNPTSIGDSIAAAKQIAESEPDAAEAEVTIYLEDDEDRFKVIWSAQYDHEQSRWPWEK